jgi:hypothetical protein
MRAALLDTPRRSALTLIGVASAAVSGLAILLHAAGWLPMYFAIDVLGPPSLMLLVLLGIYARRIDDNLVLNRLSVGAWAGMIATGAYDLIRLGLRAGRLIDFDPFRTHPIFGMLITGQPLTSSTAVAVGWAYHLWNGVGFAIMYTLVAGPAHPLFALGWAMLLEIAWLTALPSTLSFTLDPDLLLVSLVGHTAYGVVLGLLARRFIRA